MKRFFWYLKAGFLCAALVVLLGTSGVTAQDEGMGIEEGGECKTTASCGSTSQGQCFCSSTNGDCTGCFVPNGGTGCGKCSK
jgi:hypothetical protein